MAIGANARHSLSPAAPKRKRAQASFYEI